MMMRLRRLGGVVGLAMLVLLFAAPVGLVQAALVWQTETVDSEGNVGWDTSLALDSAGQPHISYRDLSNDDLKYATLDGTAWQVVTVDATGRVGRDTSLALDSDGQPHISYFDASNDDLKYATFDGSDWQVDTVEETGVVGWHTSLALDSDGQPHISYYDFTNEDLKYATFEGSDWQINPVDATGSAGQFSALALDSDGQPHISYFDASNGDLKYASFDGSGWQIDPVDQTGDVGWHSSLALDSDGQPHISYYDLTNADLKYATFDGSVWQVMTVDEPGIVGWDTSLALDSAGQPHISYFDDINDDLKYATLDGTDWQINPVDATGRVGWYTSLALDSDGQPHISYLDIINADLKYAQPTLNNPLTVEIIDPDSGTEGSAITLDATVTDPENDELTTAWTVTPVSADPGATCEVEDPNQVQTTITCDDDGTFTVELEVNDGINEPVKDTATVTIANAPPNDPDLTATLGRAQVTLSAAATDPGQNDTLTYAFDCDANGSYELDTGATSSVTCPFNQQQEGSFSFGVQVSDDDGGVATDAVTVTMATELCASNHTGVLRYSDSCRDYETAITIPDESGPVTVCASVHNGLLRSPANGACAGHEMTHELPEDGALNVCVSNYTQTLRVVGDITQCTSNEFGRVIASTEVGELPPGRSR